MQSDAEDEPAGRSPLPQAGSYDPGIDAGMDAVAAQLSRSIKGLKSWRLPDGEDGKSVTEDSELSASGRSRPAVAERDNLPGSFFARERERLDAAAREARSDDGRSAPAGLDRAPPGEGPAPTPPRVQRFDARAVQAAVAEIVRRQADLDGPLPTAPIGAGIQPEAERSRAEEPAAPATGRVQTAEGLASLVARLNARLSERQQVGVRDTIVGASAPYVSDIPQERPLPAAPSAGPARGPAMAAELRNGTSLTSGGIPLDSMAFQRSFEKLSDDLRQAIRDIDARKGVEALDRELRNVGQHLHTIGADMPHRSAISKLDRQTEEVRDILAAVERRGAALDPAEIERMLDRMHQELRAEIRDVQSRHGVETLEREMRELGRRVERIGDGLPPVETFSKIDEQNREVRDLLQAAVRGTPDLDRVERRMASLEERVSSLVDRIDVREPADQRLVDDIRGLIERLRPDQAIEALEQRIEDLHGKVDRQAVPDRSAPMLAELSRRVDEIHASLSDRLSSAKVDMRPFESLVSGLAAQIEQAPGRGPDLGRIEALLDSLATHMEQARTASADIRKLEALVVDLARKVDAERAPVDAGMLQSIEAQIGQLTDRLERSEASLAALDDVEASLSRLFSQLEETRHAAIDAAENAARIAARDTLRAAVQDGQLPVRGGDAGLDVLDRVAGEIAELKHAQEASEQRTQGSLVGLGQTMERLVEHLLQLEAAQRSDLETRAMLPAASDVGRWDRVREELRDEAPVRQSPVQVTRTPEPRAVEPLRPIERPPVLRPEPAPPAAAHTVEEDLIEPGSGRAPRRDETPHADPRLDAADAASRPQAPAVEAPIAPAVPPVRGDTDGPASFIAAARRAAQAAQASAAAATTPKPAAGERRKAAAAVEPAAAATSLLERARSIVAQRKRPMLLGVAVLVALVGVASIARLTQSDTPDEAHLPAAGTAPKIASAAPADRAAAPAPGEATPAAPAAPMARKVPLSAEPTADKGPADARPEAAPPAADKGRDTAAEPKAPTGTVPAALVSAAAIAGVPEGLRNLAAGGDPAAQFEVGVRYADGRGIVRDPKAAFAWFEQAANAGFAPAEYRLGSAYEKGLGIGRDAATAMLWYGKAADAGHARAMHNLAVMAAEGGSGKPDYVKAATWFEKAANFGVRDSQFNLAILYARGLGVAQNLAKSYTWFAIAAAQGDDDAGKKRDEVGARLDAKTLAAAKAAADSFKAQTPPPAVNEVRPPPGGWDAVGPGPVTPAKPGTPKVSVM